MSTLTQEIVKHIFNKLGVGNDNLHNAYSSIMEDKFLLTKPLCLINDEGKEVNNNMWSCSITIEDKDFKLLLADCSTLQDKEFALIVSLQNSPEYGCYFSITEPENNYISCFLNGSWVTATIYMQGAFLTGMEQVKDLSLPWSINNKTDDLFEKLTQFVGHHDEWNIEQYEG